MTSTIRNYLLLAGTLCIIACNPPADQGPIFQISFEQSLDSASLDGRLLLMLSKDESAEPRFQIQDGPGTQLVFGIDVEGMKAGSTEQITSEAFGYPIESLKDIPEGEYTVQALLHTYETFNRADGHTVKLPMDRGEGQQWNRAPGNLFSTPQKITLRKSGGTYQIEMDQKIPPIIPPEDSKYIKHIKIKSKLLSEFWGRDMYLGAHVLLPEGFDEHPEVKISIGDHAWAFSL